MKPSLCRRCVGLAWVLAGATSLSAQAQQVRGVNPADIDSRFDVIAKHVALQPEGRSQSLILKYDYKLRRAART